MTTRYRPLIILLAITILSYQLVGIGYRVIGAHIEQIPEKERGEIVTSSSPSVPAQSPLNFYAPITERNLFGTSGAVIVKDQIDIDALEPTQLRLKLLGTVAGVKGYEYAIIEESDKRRQDLFRVGDSVASATIVRIMRGMIVLRASGKDEVLRMEEETAVAKHGTREQAFQQGGTITVRKSEIDHAMSNMAKFLTQARVQPFFSPGGTANGFIISRIQKGSIFQKMGMQNGDIIQSVNGQPIQGPGEVMELYKGLQSGSEITLNIKRRGKEQDLKYIFE